MSANPTPDIRPLSLASLVFSQTPAQIERRAHFNQEKISDLAESIKSEGLLQPIVVRPLNRGDGFEVVAGERRVRAHELAGLTEVLSSIRELSDSQVAKIQLIENLQREDVHPLAEAEGYEELLKKHGYTVEQIADEVDTSKATIYARMKLLALGKESREAFYAEKLSPSHFLLLARIPIAEWQATALEHFLKPNGWSEETLSYRAAAEYVQKEFMTRLSEAPFPRDDATLIVSAGTCGACPKRTGNQPELFGDVKSADVCTDPSCFKAKCAAFSKIQLVKAKETGQPVITGAEAKKIAAYSWDGRLRNGYVRPSDKCEEDPKRRTYAQLLGKTEAPSALLQNSKSRKFSKVYKREDLREALASKGIKLRKEAAEPDHASSRARYAAEEAKRDKEEKIQEEVLRRIAIAHPGVLVRTDLEAIAGSLLENGRGSAGDILKLLGLAKRGRSEADAIPKLTDIDLSRLIVALYLENFIDPYREPKQLWAAAARFKIDPKAVRAELQTPEEAPSKKGAKK